jgi:hypothetical protein
MKSKSLSLIWERKKESIFKVQVGKNSLWDRLLFHLAFVFGPFPMKFYNNRFLVSQQTLC